MICANCAHENPEGSRFCNACASPLEAAPPAREQRKTVTVLFCDITGSTTIGESSDPEALRVLLARYFERMKAIVERHGGSVEKFIGDAVMAVFGVPVLHEDDALRAVRAAVEMRDALPELGVQARIGFNTGEVVTGTGERLATGDAVNVAARLEQAAPPGEILLGASTLVLVRDAVEAQPVAPLALEGKAEPVEAYRLIALTGEESIRRGVEAPLVGRETELRRLRDAFEQAVHDRFCQLFTLLGAAGVGKSRLAAEFLGDVEARVVRGRCLSYGQGITYWPLVEALIQLGTRPEDEAAAAAIASVLGESEAPTSPDEIAWAARKMVEQAAAEQPLVCLFEDLHWAEPAFLELVEHVADFSREAPILLLCLARPEMLERRPGWGGGKPNATTVLLEPLSAQETDELIERLAPVSPGLRARIQEAAEGNPLFVEEMLVVAREAGDGELAVPPTIQALLAARLDQLDPSERALLERGAVEGKLFHQSAVQALSPEETDVPKRLLALVRTELVRPGTPLVAGDEAFHFRHQLIRDAAYEAVPKAVRAELHERFAGWLEERGTELVERDELLGYHLEQACRYRAELGVPDERVAAKARAALAVGGRRALLRWDTTAAANLFERALALVAPGELDLPLELDLTDALFYEGRMTEAASRAGSLADRAAAVGDRVAELSGRVREAYVLTAVDPEGATDRLAALLAEALPRLEAAGADRALCLAYMALAHVWSTRAKPDSGLEAVERGLESARRLGVAFIEASFMRMTATFQLAGTTPVSQTLRWLDEQAARGVRQAILRANRASVLAMLGRFDEASSLLGELRKDAAERGAKLQLAVAMFVCADVELWSMGNPAAALELGEEGCRMLEQFGEKAWQSSAAGNVAEALFQLGRLEEADAWAGRVKGLAASDDVVTQMQWRWVRAKVLAHRGAHDSAERLAREAVAIAERTDGLNWQGHALSVLAEVLTAAGRTGEAVAALEQALGRYERKENLAMVAHVRPRLEALSEEVPTTS